MRSLAMSLTEAVPPVLGYQKVVHRAEKPEE